MPEPPQEPFDAEEIDLGAAPDPSSLAALFRGGEGEASNGGEALVDLGDEEAPRPSPRFGALADEGAEERPELYEPPSVFEGIEGGGQGGVPDEAPVELEPHPDMEQHLSFREKLDVARGGLSTPKAAKPRREREPKGGAKPPEAEPASAPEAETHHTEPVDSPPDLGGPREAEGEDEAPVFEPVAPAPRPEPWLCERPTAHVEPPAPTEDVIDLAEAEDEAEPAFHAPEQERAPEPSAPRSRPEPTAPVSDIADEAPLIAPRAQAPSRDDEAGDEHLDDGADEGQLPSGLLDRLRYARDLSRAGGPEAEASDDDVPGTTGGPLSRLRAFWEERKRFAQQSDAEGGFDTRGADEAKATTDEAPALIAGDEDDAAPQPQGSLLARGRAFWEERKRFAEQAQDEPPVYAGADISAPGALDRLRSMRASSERASSFAELLEPMSRAELEILKQDVTQETPIFVRFERSRQHALVRRRLGFILGFLLLVVFALRAGAPYLESGLSNAAEAYQPSWLHLSTEARELFNGVWFGLGLLLPFLAAFILAEAVDRLWRGLEDLHAGDLTMGLLALVCSGGIFLFLLNGAAVPSALALLGIWIVLLWISGAVRRLGGGGR